MPLTREQKQELLLAYDIDLNRGFLPVDDPLIAVPAIGQWAQLADQLPKLLVCGKVRATVDAMPAISRERLDAITERRELERAMLAFSYIGHAYVWGGERPPKSLPAQLAVPWCHIALKLQRPPVLSYASYALHNWKRIDKNAPIALGNIALIQNFLGGLDEEWFIVVHVDIEAKAGQAMAALLPAQNAVQNKDVHALEAELALVEHSLDAMYETLLRMVEGCDPYIYYHRVRPYIHGWKDHPLFPEGLLYEGVEQYKEQPQYFRGETGAQSSIIPALDAALGIVHENDRMRHYLDEMRNYMPPRHKAFIAALENGASIRKFVEAEASSNKRLHDLYNKCVEWIERFRTKHLEYARDYIHKQYQVGATNPSAVGTGGTPFMPYLEKHRDETAQHLLR